MNHQTTYFIGACTKITSYHVHNFLKPYVNSPSSEINFYCYRNYVNAVLLRPLMNEDALNSKRLFSIRRSHSQKNFFSATSIHLKDSNYNWNDFRSFFH